jgi:hypothetical protein
MIALFYLLIIVFFIASLYNNLRNRFGASKRHKWFVIACVSWVVILLIFLSNCP